MSQQRSHKKNNLSLKVKVKVLDEWRDEEAIVVISKDGKVCRTTVYKIQSDGRKIRVQAAKGNKRKHLTFEKLGGSLIERFIDARNSRQTLPIGGSWLQEEAKSIAVEIEIEDFKA